jgi:squalene-hopene/tetraprenyl-beta-curcumene cyclase
MDEKRMLMNARPGYPILLASLLLGVSALAAEKSPDVSAAGWDQQAAAKYLDYRADWWENWPNAKRDHETVCISCHTMVPYALSRPKLRTSLNETSEPAPERSMLQYLRKRVSMWSQMKPYYLDASAGPGKSRESRATESVLNAFVLASMNSGQKHLDPLTRTAFNSAWALQLKSGDQAGAWDWQVFHLAPWESSESQYQGATFMALAIGWAPDHYSRDPAIRENLKLLRSYLTREYASQSLLNQVVLLWASGKLPGLLSNAEKKQLVDVIAKKQQSDGGWNLASLGTWTRSDHTSQVTESDGYATGVVTLALKQAKVKYDRDAWTKGRAWLEAHQNKDDGSWRATSLNKQRDSKSDIGHFMTDAATGYAVLALEATR